MKFRTAWSLARIALPYRSSAAVVPAATSATLSLVGGADSAIEDLRLSGILLDRCDGPVASMTILDEWQRLQMPGARRNPGRLESELVVCWTACRGRIPSAEEMQSSQNCR